MSVKVFLKGTLILTVTGFIARIAGFFYRIFLSRTIGAQGMGLYQLILPLQALMLSLTCAGIQSSLSRLIAAYTAKGQKKEAQKLLFSGTLCATLFSCITGLFLYKYSRFFAAGILKAPAAAPLLSLTAFSLPLCALHACINSYYYALKKAAVPSLIQLMEQAARIGCSYVLYLIFLSEGRELSAMIAAGGALAGEIAASLTALTALFFSLSPHPESEAKTSGMLFFNRKFISGISGFFHGLREIFSLAAPVSLNRILITLLGGIETVLIPQMLSRHGSGSALETYGIFTGMALPVILFPSTLTGSLAVMLMPSVAELDALGRTSRIRYVIRTSILGCVLLGIFCCLGFFSLGDLLGKLLFHSSQAGFYIRMLSLACPFLYANTALTSILHGLGKPGSCLIHSICGILIRLLSVILVIPRTGIRGYFYGIFFGEFVIFLLHITVLKFTYRQPSHNRI
mgnify:FL=1